MVPNPASISMMSMHGLISSAKKPLIDTDWIDAKVLPASIGPRCDIDDAAMLPPTIPTDVNPIRCNAMVTRIGKIRAPHRTIPTFLRIEIQSISIILSCSLKEISRTPTTPDLNVVCEGPTP